MTKPFTFYGVDLSLYSGKLRAYLRFKGIPYEELPPSFVTFNFTIKRKIGDAVVPVLVSPEGEWMQDTSEIIDVLERRYPEAPVIPTSPVQKFAAYLFEIWGDEFWLATAMHMRWNHPKENFPLFMHDAVKTFFPPWAAGIGRFIVKNGLARQLNAFVEVLGVTPKTAPLLDKWTNEQLDALDRHFSVHPYLFGSCMSLGDLGLIGPLYAHLGRDPWPKRHLIEPRKHLHAWVQRMMNPAVKQGTFLPNDQLPETLEPMLRSIFREMTPLLDGGARVLREAKHQYPPGKRLPRHMGQTTCPLSTGTWTQQVFPYSLWMVQRIQDAYKALPLADAEKVRDWLRSVGGENFLNLDVPRLQRKGLRSSFS